MTIAQAQYLYGTEQYISSYGDTLQAISRKVYSSESDLCFIVLKTLNPRFDWANVKPASKIQYLNADVLTKLEV